MPTERSNRAWVHWHRDGRRFTHTPGQSCEDGCGCGDTPYHNDDCLMYVMPPVHAEPAGDRRWPQATNYEEAGRLRRAYSEAHDAIDARWDANPPVSERQVSTQWRQYNEARALIELAQVHATLAVVDELRAAREAITDVAMARLKAGGP